MSTTEGDEKIGGLVGSNEYDDARISESYAAGSVTGTTDVGGLFGANGKEVKNSYWDPEATEQSEGVGYGSSRGTTGLTTGEMTGSDAKDNMGGFDFADTWDVITGDYPTLWWE